jgi:hypothetical protein
MDEAISLLGLSGAGSAGGDGVPGLATMQQGYLFASPGSGPTGLVSPLGSLSGEVVGVARGTSGVRIGNPGIVGFGLGSGLSAGAGFSSGLGVGLGVGLGAAAYGIDAAVLSQIGMVLKPGTITHSCVHH